MFRIISAIELLRKTAIKTPFPALNGDSVEDVLQISTDLLLRKFTTSSKWVLCRLYNIQTC